MSSNVVDYVSALGEAGVTARADIKSYMRGDAIDRSDMDALLVMPTNHGVSPARAAGLAHAEDRSPWRR